jgi:hypothetical protein
VADEPFFPPPKKKGDAYREPARIIVPAAEPSPKRIVVSRAIEDDAPETREEKVGSLLEDARDERGFWERHSFWANHPRITGAILFVVGGVLSIPVIEAARAHAGYRMRGSALGVLMASTGLWSLIAGYPVERDGRFPRWWVLGLVVANALGVLLLLAAMMR